MTKLSRSQGFRLRGTNRKELLLKRVLVQAHVDLIQTLVALVQAHPPQGGLIWMVKRQVVVGPGSGLVGAVWTVFVRGGNRFVTYRLCVGWGPGWINLFYQGQRGELATLTLMLHHRRNSGG